ncbi:MAG: tetratricopeptide repeat protein, partial [Spirulina sp. SIO3F2]|nr:tetratricopeptide repeat protein [Spirulina sp. SIO3F2]
YRFELPTYEFVGRDLEILKIEKALLRHNVLLLRGMGGTGKTTLLNYLRDWWQTTQFVQGVFYFGYDETAHTLQAILRELGKGLYPDGYDFAAFEAMPLDAQMEDIAEQLRATPYALMLDNLESVTGQALAIPNTLPEAEQALIRDFLALLRGGKTKVVLGSRSGEDWLASIFTAKGRRNVYDLRGLDAAARTDLAEQILGQERLEGLRDDRTFGRLMDVLAGYPLAMEVVLANLARQTPEAVLAALDAAGVDDLDVGGTERTNNILKCVEYSHSNLSPEAQRLLICLAPFHGFIDRADLANYGKQLQQFEPFADYDFAGFDAAVEEAVHWGLLSPISAEMPRLLTIQPIFPYFLRTKVQALDEGTREALRDGFKNHYQGLARQYEQLMGSKNPQERQLGLFFCKFEYENLYSALQICLDKQEESFWKSYSCLSKYLETIGDKVEHFELAKFIYSCVENYQPQSRTSNVELYILGVLDSIALGYLKAQNYSEAKGAYQETLNLIQGLTEFPEDFKQKLLASTYHQLGIVAQELRDYEQARSHYQQALDLNIEFNDRYSQAKNYHQLGIVAQELRDYEQARSHFQQALNICIEFNDRYNQAKIYHQLGIVAQELRDYEQARSHYQQALDLNIEFNDRYEQAKNYHQLGSVAQAQRDYEQARSHFQQALDLKIEFNDRYSQASTYHQLGSVAEEQRDYEQARSHFQQALDLKIEFNDRYSQASTYHQLGSVAEEQRDYEQARSHYQQALNICIEFNDRHSQASTYHQLGRVAQEQRDYEQARSHYQQALDLKIEFNDRYSQASTYGQLGLLAESQEDYAQAQQHLLQALVIFAEFGDEHSIGITIQNLARLHQTIQDDNILTTVAEALGGTVEQLQELFAQVDKG